MKQNVADCHAQAYFPSDFGEAANTDAVATMAADATVAPTGNNSQLQFWVSDWIVWSYNATPTTGRLTVTAGSTVLLDIDITNGGPGELRFAKDGPLYHVQSNGTIVRGEALTVKLYAGGSAVTGKVMFRVR